MANILSVEMQLAVLKLLVEGSSISGTSRITGVHRDTISRLLVRFGRACQKFLDKELRDLQIDHLQLDEIWTFCRKKRYRVTGQEQDRHEIGDIYIFVAFDEDSRLVLSHRAGKRDQLNTNVFIHDIAKRLRLPKPHDTDAHAYEPELYKPVVRISTDGYPAYLPAIDAFLGRAASYALLEKDVSGRGRNKHVEITKTIVSGDIDEKDVSTSLVERQNLTIRTFMKRLARKTICFSKRLANLRAATALNFAHYNYCWRVKTLKTTPAVAAGVVGRPWRLRDLYEHARECAPECFLG